MQCLAKHLTRHCSQVKAASTATNHVYQERSCEDLIDDSDAQCLCWAYMTTTGTLIVSTILLPNLVSTNFLLCEGFTNVNLVKTDRNETFIPRW